MANGKIRFGKQSGGQLALIIPDGVGNTEVVFPENGDLVNKEYIDNTTVNLTGNQTIAGVKTFTSSPIVPSPTTDTQAANKSYVDLKQSKSELAYNVDTSSYISNTLASGAIIERGSNVNGEYIKYADGTMICTASLPDEIDYLWNAGTWFKYSNFPLKTNGWLFPHVFSVTPLVYITSLNDEGTSGNSDGLLAQYYETNTTTAKFDGKATVNITRIIRIKVVAIGRWK